MITAQNTQLSTIVNLHGVPHGYSVNVHLLHQPQEVQGVPHQFGIRLVLIHNHRVSQLSA